MATLNEIDRRRELFPTLSAGSYLLSHSLGPMPTTAAESMQSYLNEWQHHAGEDAWAKRWWELSTTIGDLVGRLIGAAPGTVGVQPNASLAQQAVNSCFDFTRRGKNKVVTTALDFPSMGYVWDQQRRLGVNVHVVESEDDIHLDTQQILEAIDDQTVLVALSHVSYRSSHRVDQSAIIRRAHEVDAYVALDAYQSIGVLPIDVEDWGVDFMIGGSIKWLCGGPSCGYLYVRPDLITKLKPRLTGWIAHKNPFDFSHDEMIYDESIRRFSQGTPSIPALYSVQPGLEIINEVGVEAIATESRRRTQRIVDCADERGWRLHSPRDVDRRGGSVMIEVQNPFEKVEQLAKDRVFVDARPGVGLRVSPHFFNTDDEIEYALETIARLLA